MSTRSSASERPGELAASRRPWLRWGLLALAAGLFVAFRWWVRSEPLNSDDLTLWSVTRRAAAFDHWLFLADNDLGRINHHALRIGLLLVSVPLYWLTGPGPAAFYLTPLVFALVGFLVVWKIMDREVDPWLAAGFALVHLGLFFEVREGTVLLTDLPSAVAMMGALLLVDSLARRPPASRQGLVLQGLLAALPLMLAYLLRANSLVLVAPGLLVLWWARRSRALVAVAGAWVVAGVLAEQLLFVAKGLGFGFRWGVVDRALDGYSPLLPWYTPGELAVRWWTELAADLGTGPGAVFLLALYLAMLVASVALALRTESPLLRAVAVTGLATWAVFSFAPLEWQAGRVHAMAPVNYRYLQPFYYGGLVALCWAVRALAGRLGVRGRWPTRLAVAALALAGVLATVTHVPHRLHRPDGEVLQTVAALDALAAVSPAPLEVLGPPSSLRSMTLFRGSWSRPTVDWEGNSPDELVAELSWRPRVLVLDELRVRRDLRLGHTEAAGGDVAALEALRASLFRRHVRLDTGGSRYGVYVPYGLAERLGPGLRPRRPVARLADLGGELQVSRPLEVVAGDDGSLTLAGDVRGGHVYLSNGQPASFDVAPRIGTSFPVESGATVEVLAWLELDPAVEARLFLIQYDGEERIGDASWSVGDGLFRFTTRVVEGAAVGRLALRFEIPGDGERPIPEIRIREVAVRPGEAPEPSDRAMLNSTARWQKT